MRRTLAQRHPLERLAFLGVSPEDPDELRTQKAVLTFAAVGVTALATVWVGTYLVLGLVLSAAIPLGYQLASLVSLGVFSRTKSYPPFRLAQVALMTALPFLLQWSLGGYVASSAVSLWALVAVLASLFFYRARAAVPWFVVFLVLTAVSGLIDPAIAATPAPVPDTVRVAFFVLNVGGVALVAFTLLLYSVRAQEEAFGRSEGLLANVLPASIVTRLKHERKRIAEAHDDVTVLFADVVDFTRFAERTDAERVVTVLDSVFSAFDDLARRHGLEKIKTVGDAYMLVGGLPEPRSDHADAVAAMALDMLPEIRRLSEVHGVRLDLRIGIHSGPVIAGVIGRDKYLYDVWGDTVNTASRMESHGVVGRVQVSEATFRRLDGRYACEERGIIDVKGKGPLRVYLLAPADAAGSDARSDATRSV